jgi:hypothetical protein
LPIPANVSIQVGESVWSTCNTDVTIMVPLDSEQAEPSEPSATTSTTAIVPSSTIGGGSSPRLPEVSLNLLIFHNNYTSFKV